METLMGAKAALVQALIVGPGYGLDLIERVRERSGGQIKLGQGSVYPALRSLEREGLVESYEGAAMPERGGRPRRYYRLTALGEQAADFQREGLLQFLSAAPVMP